MYLIVSILYIYITDIYFYYVNCKINKLLYILNLLCN